MSFRLVPKSMTLNDLERRNVRYFALFQRIFVYLPDVLRKRSRSLSHLLMSSCLLWKKQGSAVAVADKPARRSAASRQTCYKQIRWALGVVNLRPSSVDNASRRKSDGRTD